MFTSRSTGKEPDIEFYIEGFACTEIAILDSAQRVEISPSLEFYICTTYNVTDRVRRIGRRPRNTHAREDIMPLKVMHEISHRATSRYRVVRGPQHGPC